MPVTDLAAITVIDTATVSATQMRECIHLKLPQVKLQHYIFSISEPANLFYAKRHVSNKIMCTELR